MTGEDEQDEIVGVRVRGELLDKLAEDFVALSKRWVVQMVKVLLIRDAVVLNGMLECCCIINSGGKVPHKLLDAFLRIFGVYVLFDLIELSGIKQDY